MKTDRITKLLLLAIALFLGIIAFKPFLQPAVAYSPNFQTGDKQTYSEYKLETISKKEFNRQWSTQDWDPISVTHYSEAVKDTFVILWAK